MSIHLSFPFFDRFYMFYLANFYIHFMLALLPETCDSVGILKYLLIQKENSFQSYPIKLGLKISLNYILYFFSLVSYAM